MKWPNVKIKRIIREGDMYSNAWYGVAYEEYDTRQIICYPIPFNLIIAWLRVCHQWLRCSMKVRTFSYHVYTFNNGYKAGYRDGSTNSQLILAKGITSLDRK